MDRVALLYIYFSIHIQTYHKFVVHGNITSGWFKNRLDIILYSKLEVVVPNQVWLWRFRFSLLPHHNSFHGNIEIFADLTVC